MLCSKICGRAPFPTKGKTPPNSAHRLSKRNRVLVFCLCIPHTHKHNTIPSVSDRAVDANAIADSNVAGGLHSLNTPCAQSLPLRISSPLRGTHFRMIYYLHRHLSTIAINISITGAWHSLPSTPLLLLLLLPRQPTRPTRSIRAYSRPILLIQYPFSVAHSHRTVVEVVLYRRTRTRCLSLSHSRPRMMYE